MEEPFNMVPLEGAQVIFTLMPPLLVCWLSVPLASIIYESMTWNKHAGQEIQLSSFAHLF